MNHHMSGEDRYRQEAANWQETARRASRSYDYMYGLLKQIGEAIGDEAYIADDGTRSDGVLVAKLPELVRARLGIAQGQEARPT